MNRRVWILFVALGLSTIFAFAAHFLRVKLNPSARYHCLRSRFKRPSATPSFAGDTLYLAVTSVSTQDWKAARENRR